MATKTLAGSSSGSAAVLNNGAEIPVLGLGMASGFTPDEVVESAVSAVLAALEAGYRLFDTASLYGTERALGKALRVAFQRDLVSRDQVFVISKLWCDDNHPDDVLPALQKSLKELQLDYLDLYLIHWPARLKKGVRYPHIKPDDVLAVDLVATWKAMEKCVESGLTKSIGVSNFSPKKIEALLRHASIPPAANQVEMNPMWNPQEVKEYCKDKNIHVIAYAPLGLPMTSVFAASGGLLQHPTVTSIAAKHGRSPAQVTLRWGLEEGVTLIPKSYNTERIKQNACIFDFSLDDDDRKKLMNLPQKRVYDGKEFVDPIHGPYRSLYELWDDEIFLLASG